MLVASTTVKTPRFLGLLCLVGAAATIVVAGFGVHIRAAGVGAAAVDEPQYLLSALSLFQDRDLNIADERAEQRYAPFHDVSPPVQTSVLDDGRRISPHDPLLPLLLAVPMGLGGYIAAKWALVLSAGLLTASTIYLAATRFAVPPVLATVVVTVAAVSPPLAVYAHQVYPELPAALAVVLCVIAMTRKPSANESPLVTTAKPMWTVARAAVVVACVTALPWLAAKYMLVAGALAVVALASAWRTSRRVAVGMAAALAASGAAWIAGHWLIYGGWTSYATGDHFEERGEFSAVGFAPNLMGRSARLVGLLVDRDFGLAAWQPAWILGAVGIGMLIAYRRWEILAPVAAGWITATFIALTMQGYWWPGRQVVVILPLVAVGVAAALANAGPLARTTLAIVGGGFAAAGLGIMGWLTAGGRRGELTWVMAPDQQPSAWIEVLRLVLPDYRDPGLAHWAVHSLWAAAILTLVVWGYRLAPPHRSLDLDPARQPVEEIHA